MKKLCIYDRALSIGEYILNNKCTIRETAVMFEVSKSTVHKDIHTILPDANQFLYSEVQIIMDNNFNERNIRGGMATQKKYAKKQLN